MCKYLVCYGLTHIGKVRSVNEDCFVSLPENGLWIVADGMGGYEAGEIASKIAVDTISKEVLSGASLTEAIQSAHKKILGFSQKNKVSRMGCTVVALKVQDKQYEIAWVGDSRAYKWDGKDLILLTKDHSLVQELIDKGSLTIEEARRYPHKNIITRALGFGENVDVDIIRGQMKEGDSFLLCTDGLIGELNEQEIVKILSLGKSPKETCELLINSALSKEANDNITIVVVGQPTKAQRIEKGSTQKLRNINYNKKQTSLVLVKKIQIWTVIAISLLMVVFFIFYFYDKRGNTINKKQSHNNALNASKIFNNSSYFTNNFFYLNNSLKKTLYYECKIVADKIFAEIVQSQEPKERTLNNLKKCLLKNKEDKYLRNAYLEVYNAYWKALKLNLKRKNQAKVIIYKNKINELVEFNKKENLNLLFIETFAKSN